MPQYFTDPTPGSAVQVMSPDQLHRTYEDLWGPVRSVLQDSFSFGDIKSIVGTAGLDITKIAHLNQAGSGGASKGQLMTGIDQVYVQMVPEEKKQFVTIAVEEMLQHRQDITERLDEVLSRLGWSIINSRLLPIHLLDKSELHELPQDAQADLVKAATRLRDGDLSGAISAACGAVDSVTGKVYRDKSLGDPGPAAFQERVSRSLDATGTVSAIEAELVSIGWETGKSKQFAQNVRGSLNQAANVMQTLRSSMGDVHGTKPALKALVFDSLQWAKLIVGLLQKP